MALPDVIARRPSAPSLDYETLRIEALRFIQQLSGEVWTDYNEHDPGVTILEQLCYALTELSYRAGFPVTDLLAGPSGRVDTRRQALHTPRRILPGDPVTANDFRKLLVDRVPGLGNVWLEPWRPQQRQAVDGLYDIFLYAPAADPCVCECAPPDPLVAQTLSVYARHRGLCEDVHRIVVLRPARTIIYATVMIEGSDPPESIMAELLYRAGQSLAPEVRRTPLTELIAAGLPPSELFEGPLLRNGFIADSELCGRAREIGCAELVKAMAACRGVLSVNEVTVRVGRKTYGVSESIPVPAGEILRLDAGFDLKFLPIRLTRRGGVCKLDRERVRQELARRWRAHRRTHPLSRDYEQVFALPHGRHRDLAQYSSLQAQFPAIYGVGPRGLPADAPPLRRAQAKQLKGYLLVFEQLLADYLAQLSHARDLLSVESGHDRSYFGQPVADVLPDMDQLLVGDGAGIDQLRREHDPWVDRRNRFLDLLLSLYAENITRELPSPCGNGASGDDAGERLIDAKLGLLRRVVTLTRARGRGFDYLAERSARNIAGMELRSSLHLGMDLDPAASHSDRTRLSIVEHVLLRAGRNLRGGKALEGGKFQHGLTVSAVVWRPGGDAQEPAFCHQVADILRANAPAHVVVLTHFLTAELATRFEALHAAWCEALRTREPRAIIERSVALRDFLVRCAPASEAKSGARQSEQAEGSIS